MRRGMWVCGSFLRAAAEQESVRLWYCVLTAGIMVQLALLLGLAEIVLKELANDLLGEENLIYA